LYSISSITGSIYQFKILIGTNLRLNSQLIVIVGVHKSEESLNLK